MSRFVHVIPLFCAHGLAFLLFAWPVMPAPVTGGTPGGAPGPGGLERVADDGLDLVAYARVARSDGRSRRMPTSPEALATLVQDGDLPEGTRILMETYYRPGAIGIVFHNRKGAGRWEYGSFAPGRTDLTARSQATCHFCHSLVAETGFVFTRSSMAAAARSGTLIDFTCPRPRRRPCEPELYQSAARSGDQP